MEKTTKEEGIVPGRKLGKTKNQRRRNRTREEKIMTREEGIGPGRKE